MTAPSLGGCCYEKRPPRFEIRVIQPEFKSRKLQGSNGRWLLASEGQGVAKPGPRAPQVTKNHPVVERHGHEAGHRSTNRGHMPGRGTRGWPSFFR